MTAAAHHGAAGSDADGGARAGAGPAVTRTVTTLPALERELSAGLLASWTALVQDDPLASPFQSPTWCMPWYRSYHDEVDPFVVVVQSGGRLAGVVPLATRRRTGEILFASGTMADYRDIVARPDARPLVVRELLRVYLAGRFPNSLQIGWIDPGSDTPALVAQACADAGVRLSSWQQPCYRWFPAPGENLNKKFSRVRTHLNFFKRSGEVTFDVITTGDEWTAFREAFFRQHTLRQLQADRPVSFDDPRKRRFYDRVFDSAAIHTHVTALRLNGALLSGHIGIVWKDVLMLGAPSISLEHEGRSPSLVLLSWILQNAEQLGLRGLDLTVGDTEFKRRLGNQSVNVTMIEVHGNPRRYYARRARTEAIAVAKGVVAAVWGTEAWKAHVAPRAARVAGRLAAIREHGLVPALRLWSARVTPARDDEYERWAAQDLPAIEAAVDRSVPWRTHQNSIEDLLLASGGASTWSAVRECARSYARRRAEGGTLHTLVAGDGLAGWCFVNSPIEGRMSVTAVHVPDEWAARGARRALMAEVARSAFAAGVTHIDVPRGR